MGILTLMTFITSVIWIMAGRRAVVGSGSGRGSSSGRGEGTGRGDGSGGRGGGSGGRGGDGNGGRGGDGNGGLGGADGRGSGSGRGDGSGGQNNGNGGQGEAGGSGVGGHSSGASGGGEAGGSGSGEAGGSGSGEAGGSGGGEAGGFRGRGSGSRRARGGHRHMTIENGDTSETDTHLAHWDDEGRRIVPLGVDADPRNHRMRGYSPGGFGIYPSTPTVIQIAGDEVVDAKAKRNILAIMRMYWPVGCVTAREVDRTSPGFWQTCLNEFLRYYTWNPVYANEAEAKSSIITHMHKNFRHLPSDDKKRVEKIISTEGGTFIDHRPTYLHPDVWETLCRYWKSAAFEKRSEAGKKAREMVGVPHTSGAKSFETRRREYKEKHKGRLNHTRVYKDCHTRKDKKRKGQWITKKAKQIMICKDKGIDPKETQIQSWVEAVGGVRKNKILSYPRLRACDVLGSEMCSPPPRKGEGSSGRSDIVRIHDDIFMQVVDETLAQARANPDEFTLSPEQIRVLAHDVVDGDSSLPPDHPIARETRQSIIRVMIEILNNIYKRDGPGAEKGKAPMDEDEDGGMDEDGGTDDEDDDDDGISEDDGDGDMDDYEGTESADDDRDMSSPSQVISIGGPKING